MQMCIFKGTTGDYESEINRLKEAFHNADAVLVGAGAGLSTAAGLDYSGERLQKYFGDFAAKYGMPNMYNGCFAPFESREERWAYWSRWAWVNRYMDIPGDTLKNLKALLEKKDDWFILTTNIDHSFRRSGFPKDRTCYTQGDLGLFQCSVPCHTDTCDNYEAVRRMIEAQGYVPNKVGYLDVPPDGKIRMTVPTDLIPHCQRCGAEMDFNLFWDERFVRDSGWHTAHDRYVSWTEAHRTGKILYFELGVGYNSPGVIKVPFWQMTAANPDAVFASINLDSPSGLDGLQKRSIIISEDIDKVIRDLLQEMT